MKLTFTDKPYNPRSCEYVLYLELLYLKLQREQKCPNVLVENFAEETFEIQIFRDLIDISTWV